MRTGKTVKPYSGSRTIPAGGGLPAMRCHIGEPGCRRAGYVLLLHGRDGAGASGHLLPIAEVYMRRGWLVVAPDLGRSRATPDAGAPQDFTLGYHISQSRRALAWLAAHFGEPPALALAGHSMGAFAIACLGDEYGGVHHLLAVSPVVSGQALLDARTAMGPPAIEAMRRDAPALFDELPGIDARPHLGRIAAPLAVITGLEDGITPVGDARDYFFAATNGRCFAAIPGQHHCPDGPHYAQALGTALDMLAA